MLTICFLTNRVEPKFHWFFDSLFNECHGNFSGIKLVAVDFWKNKIVREWDEYIYSKVPRDKIEFIHVEPKPAVWQGDHRLTKENYFAASNARNTGLCYASDGYIVYADDLSVLLPGWLDRVRAAMIGNYIVCGAYKKKKNLVVENGSVLSCEEFPPGVDNRLSHANKLISTSGNWLYGCSCAIPVEALLNINGWPENLCDGMGFEDCLTGIVLSRSGCKLKYDPQMMTYESEEMHHIEPAFKRSDFGASPKDKSHKALDIANSSVRFNNDFGDGFTDIRVLRKRILFGEQFPIRTHPTHEWFTGQSLATL